MKISIGVVLALVVTGVTLAQDAPRSYADAKAVWERSRSKLEYQNYAAEFSQFNNHFHLDEKGGCYQLAWGR